MQRVIISLSMLLFLLTTETIAQEAKEHPVTLSSLIGNALENNPELQKLKLEQEGTQVRKKIVNSTFIPKISANAMYGLGQFGLSDLHIGIPIPMEAQAIGGALAPALGMEGNPIPPEFNTTLNLEYNDLQIFTAGVNAEWILFTGMKATYSNRALSHKYNAQQQMLNKQTSEVIVEVVNYYDKLVLVHQSELVIQNSETRLSKEKERISKAFQHGLLTKYDLQKIVLAELELASKKLELNSNKRLIILKLKQLCGVNEVDLQFIGNESHPMFINEPLVAIEERPEMKALHEKELAMENKLKAANSGYLPKVAALANYQYADLDLAKVDPIAFVGVGAKWELFDGLKTSREKQLIKLEIEQEHQESKRIRELLELDMEMKQSNALQAQAQMVINQKQVEQSKLALKIRTKALEQGLCDIASWLEADNEFQKAQLNYHKSVFEQRQSTLQILKTKGDLQHNYQQLIEQK